MYYVNIKGYKPNVCIYILYSKKKKNLVEELVRHIQKKQIIQKRRNCGSQYIHERMMMYKYKCEENIRYLIIRLEMKHCTTIQDSGSILKGRKEENEIKEGEHREF